jgi:hypothetical protein
MSNIQECTELSHIPVSVWAEKNLLWKIEHEDETALKRANTFLLPHSLPHAVCTVICLGIFNPGFVY